MPEVRTEKCKKCPAIIVWALTEQGKWMPLDAKPERRFTLAQDEQGRWKATPVASYAPHWSTCPEADAFRRPAPKERTDLE